MSAVVASAPSVYIADARLVRLAPGQEPRPGGVLVDGDTTPVIARARRDRGAVLPGLCLATELDVRLGYDRA